MDSRGEINIIVMMGFHDFRGGKINLLVTDIVFSINLRLINWLNTSVSNAQSRNI